MRTSEREEAANARPGSRMKSLGLPVTLGILAGAASLLLLWSARLAPGIVEAAYSRGVYPVVARPLAAVSGAIPFAIGEVVYALLFVAAAVYGVRATRRRRAAGGPAWKSLLAGVTAGVSVGGWILAATIAVHALNYARPGPEAVFDLPDSVSPARAEQLIERIGRDLDELRSGLTEDGRGVAVVPSELAALDTHLSQLQAELLQDVGQPAIRPGRTKPMLFRSVLGRYIRGMYVPLTGEPTIAWTDEPVVVPAIVAHERAHLSGFTGEDDASFVGLLTTLRSPRPDIRYAGLLELWLETGLGRAERSEAVQRDILAVFEYRDERVGFEAPIVLRGHDALLRGFGEREGIRSYDRVVELALRYFDAHGVPGASGP